jgi:hypothetical protein
MVRMLFALSIVLAGLVLGLLAEVASQNNDEPLLESGVVLAAFVVSSILAVTAYLLWSSKSN